MTIAAPAEARKSEATVPRVAFVHDYLTQRGGAERVILAMHRAFPEAPIYTSLYRPTETFPDFREADIRTLPINAIPLFRRNHRLALPILAPAFSSLVVDARVVICSSSGWAHAARATGRKIVYCYTPARWLYQTDRYLGANEKVAGFIIRVLRPFLVAWDKRAAHSADLYIAQSSVVRTRIWSTYRVDACMLPAPHSMNVAGFRQPVSGLPDRFFLVVSRLLPYKNIGAVIEAFSQTAEYGLVIVGTGPEAQRLRRAAGPNIRFLETVTDEALAWLYANCTAVVSAAYEDFGLIPLEAAAFGKPAIALRWGGFLDTVIDGETGVFFDSAHPDNIWHAVRRLAKMDFSPEALAAHAAEYSEQRFVRRLRDIVDAELARS